MTMGLEQLLYAGSLQAVLYSTKPGRAAHTDSQGFRLILLPVLTAVCDTSAISSETLLLFGIRPRVSKTFKMLLLTRAYTCRIEWMLRQRIRGITRHRRSESHQEDNGAEGKVAEALFHFLDPS